MKESTYEEKKTLAHDKKEGKVGKKQGATKSPKLSHNLSMTKGEME